MADNISKFFGIIDDNDALSTDIEIVDQTDSNIVMVDEKKPDTDEDIDYNLARKNITKITEIGLKSLEEISDLAPKLQNYKAYEAISTLVKSMVDANKDLAELSRKKTQLSKYDDDNAPTLNDNAQQNITNNSIFVGTTKELIEIMKNKKNNG